MPVDIFFNSEERLLYKVKTNRSIFSAPEKALKLFLNFSSGASSIRINNLKILEAILENQMKLCNQ